MLYVLIIHDPKSIRTLREYLKQVYALTESSIQGNNNENIGS